MKIDIVQFESIHAYDILGRNILFGRIERPDMKYFDECVHEWKDRGPASTLIINEEIVCCAGVTLMGYGRGEAWSLLSGLFYVYKKTSYKAIRDGLNSIIRDKKLRRVQSMVIRNGNGYEARRNFLEHLGFYNETPRLMRYYGPHGESVYMYSRITEQS